MFWGMATLVGGLSALPPVFHCLHGSHFSLYFPLLTNVHARFGLLLPQRIAQLTSLSVIFGDICIFNVMLASRMEAIYEKSYLLAFPPVLDMKYLLVILRAESSTSLFYFPFLGLLVGASFHSFLI